MSYNVTWYLLEDENKIDSPGLIFFEDRIKENITRLINTVGDTRRLRPHVKTHKSADITRFLLEAGISKFKCATIAEAEMLADCGAPDVLMAYQPVGPTLSRFMALQQRYPDIKFSCLVDNVTSGQMISKASEDLGLVTSVYLDLNVGMNRTGLRVSKAVKYYKELTTSTGVRIIGLHAYDGHIHEADYQRRQELVRPIIATLNALRDTINATPALQIVAGGTPTFPIYCAETNFDCSPGTFTLWDYGYGQAFLEQDYLPAAVLITRVISIPAANLICTDLGHKAVAAENTLQKRVFFLNAPQLIPVSQSEEHLVLKTTYALSYKVGDVLYALPYHVCPTVALYDTATSIASSREAETWTIHSRKRRITL